MSRTSKPGLGYLFAPVPRWLRSERQEGRLSDSDYDLLAFLYGCATFDALKARQETPRLRLERIADGVRWKHDPESLQKRLRRLRGRYFDYRLEGNPRTGFTYVFTLFPDGPGPSDIRPSKTDAARPSIGDTEDGTGSGNGRVRTASPSVDRPAGNAEVRPLIDATRPSIGDGAKPLPVRDSEADVTAPRPSVLRRSRETKTLNEQGLTKEKRLGSSSEDHLVGEGTPRDEDGVVDLDRGPADRATGNTAAKPRNIGELVRLPDDVRELLANGEETRPPDRFASSADGAKRGQE